MCNVSFIDIILNSGGIGIIIWLFLFLISIAGLILGIISMITSANSSEDKYPIALKLLLCLIPITILTGTIGTITGYIDSFMGLACSTGTAKEQLLHLSLNQSRVCIHFSLGVSFVQLLFLLFSLFLFHSDSYLALGKSIAKIPVIVYVIISSFIILLIGFIYCFWEIENMFILKPGETLPKLFDLEFSFILNSSISVGLLGLILLIIFCISLFFKKPNKLQPNF